MSQRPGPQHAPDPEFFLRVYKENQAPWVTDRPQKFLLDLCKRENFQEPVMDVGCGTGENALWLAAQGLSVTAIDFSPDAIAHAQEKAKSHNSPATFRVGDALDPSSFENGKYATLIDSAVFHAFDGADRKQYVKNLYGALKAGGVLYMLCMNEHEPGDNGPLRVSQEEICDAFSEGWNIEWIVPSFYEVKRSEAGAQCWLSKVVKQI